MVEVAAFDRPLAVRLHRAMTDLSTIGNPSEHGIATPARLNELSSEIEDIHLALRGHVGAAVDDVIRGADLATPGARPVARVGHAITRERTAVALGGAAAGGAATYAITRD